eukprot:2151575-Pleurochrysis_carterae.AAC.2
MYFSSSGMTDVLMDPATEAEALLKAFKDFSKMELVRCTLDKRSITPTLLTNQVAVPARHQSGRNESGGPTSAGKPLRAQTVSPGSRIGDAREVTKDKWYKHR